MDDRSTRSTPTDPAQAALKPWNLRNFTTAAAADWRISRTAVLAILVLPFVVVLTGVVTALMGKEAYKWFIGEDGFGENLQALAFAGAGIAAIWTGMRLRSSPDKFATGAFLFVGLALLWVTGEEISWGQRVLELETPEALEAINRQGELNIHNIYPIEVALRWAQFFVGAWGAVLPFIVIRYADRLTRWHRYLKYAVPHYTLAVYFACTMLWRAYRNVMPDPPERFSFVVAEWSEVMEVNLALGLMLFMTYQLRCTFRPEPAPAPDEPGTLAAMS